MRENQARSIPSKNRSGFILALLSGASRVPRVSEPRGTDNNGGLKRDRGTRHGLVLLGYLAERPTMTATSQRASSMDNTWPSDLRTFGDVHDRAVSKMVDRAWNTCASWKIFPCRKALVSTERKSGKRNEGISSCGVNVFAVGVEV